MDAFKKMQQKFDSLMNIVSHEEEKFREIEQRHMYNTKAMMPQQSHNRASEVINSYCAMYDQNNRSGMSGNQAFDDVTSIKTDQFKLSAREHNLLENHLFT